MAARLQEENQKLIDEQLESRLYYINKTNQAQQELTNVQQQLLEYQGKMKIINEEIRRERELELEQDAHRIILSDNDKQDIKFLVSIVNNLRHPDILYKLI